jgi:hypothetical protein
VPLFQASSRISGHFVQKFRRSVPRRSWSLAIRTFFDRLKGGQLARPFALSFAQFKSSQAGVNFRTKCPEMPPPGGDGRRLDKSIPATPVVAAPREQPHRIAVAPRLQPVAVVLDLVHPVGPSGRLRGARGNAGLDEPTGTDDRSGAAADQPRDMVQAKL